jgi:hypothetical protein
MLALVVPACTSSAPAGGPKHATVTVRPANSLADQAVHINVAGLSAGELATVQVTSTDSAGVPWVASARYRADASGEINLDQAAPVSGSYHGVSGMGLIWSMHQVSPGSAAAGGEGGYFWSLAAPFRFTVTVTSAGTTVARTSFQRRFSAGQVSRPLAARAVRLPRGRAPRRRFRALRAVGTKHDQ